jgi:NADPH-dependent ferric siderophore reductase
VGGSEVGELVVDVVQHVAAQPVEVRTAGAQHGDRVLILGQREQQMLEGGIFMPALVSVSESPMQRLFEIA